MQEVKYRVVRKKSYSVGDIFWLKSKNCSYTFHVESSFQRVITHLVSSNKSHHVISNANLLDIGIKNHDGTYNVMEMIEDVAESATTEAPAPETRTIEIDGERFTVTRKPCGGWSEPVPWVPAVGDEVRLSELSEGDRVLVYGVVHDRVGELGKVGVRLPNGNDCVKWFRPSVQVIYNGRAE